MATHYMGRKLNTLSHFLLSTLCLLLFSCGDGEQSRRRPIEPWAFRSVLDGKPRMLTLALDTSLYVSYDLSRCTLYKAWRGGVRMEGAAYTDKKNVQPTSWGASYLADTTLNFQWITEADGKRVESHIQSKGYYFKQGGIFLTYQITLPSGDTLRIEEHPEFVRSDAGNPALQRSFNLSKAPRGITVSIQSADAIFSLKANGTAVWLAHFKELPPQNPPKVEEGYDHPGRYFMERSDCMTCHEFDKQTVGPSFRQIAQKYPREKTAMQYLVRKIQEGGSGAWGTTPMNPHPNLDENKIRQILNYIFLLKPADATDYSQVSVKKAPEIKKSVPGFGAPLEALHPSFDLYTIRKEDFKPRVGGLAFLPDGRLLVTTWDTMGGVYLLDHVTTGDTANISVKRIASGLAEPLGIEVVDGEIYVLQKHELTRLKDRDGDDVIDEYETVCNSWGVTSDFHEFAFGLVYKDGYFYATLSMAMRLMSDERQHPDRGRTIKIARDGHYEWVNYGLRTPNGIGIGVDNEIFVTDNQGEWIPANKLIHVKRGTYNGMQWGLPGKSTNTPIFPPAIWLPQDEIGNSPTEPILIHHGVYKGQMLHGDVTHGGIKRDFLELVNGGYQGAVFRFTQGLEAGVNRLVWGPDSALYVGGIGMVGGWSWKDKQYGLQKLKYNNKTTFEMLAIRAKPNGFEIEFTQPIRREDLSASDLLLQQWRYEGTAAYGGRKLDLETLAISKMDFSEDGKRTYLEIDGLKKAHIIYFRLPETLKSTSDQPLWSGEAWYTLNNIPTR